MTRTGRLAIHSSCLRTVPAAMLGHSSMPYDSPSTERSVSTRTHRLSTCSRRRMSFRICRLPQHVLFSNAASASTPRALSYGASISAWSLVTSSGCDGDGMHWARGVALKLVEQNRTTATKARRHASWYSMVPSLEKSSLTLRKVRVARACFWPACPACFPCATLRFPLDPCAPPCNLMLAAYPNSFRLRGTSDYFTCHASCHDTWDTLVSSDAKLTTIFALFTTAAPRVELFEALHQVLLGHPWSLRASLMLHLLECVPTSLSLKDAPRLARLRATRFLGNELRGAALCDALSAASETFVKEIAAADGSDTVRDEYARWVATWVVRHEEPGAEAGRAAGPSAALQLDPNMVSLFVLLAIVCARFGVRCGAFMSADCLPRGRGGAHSASRTTSSYSGIARLLNLMIADPFFLIFTASVSGGQSGACVPASNARRCARGEADTRGPGGHGGRAGGRATCSATASALLFTELKLREQAVGARSALGLPSAFGVVTCNYNLNITQ